MITCPWCGTSYAAFQSNCQKCGGPLLPPGQTPVTGDEAVIMPPPPPRPIAANYVWKLLVSDGGAIAAFVLLLLGAIFLVTSGGLILGIITAFIGVPFFIVALGLLVAGGVVGYRRYQDMQAVTTVLRMGEAVEGRITGVEENYHVEINNRNPWLIRYSFQLDGQEYTGKVSTLNSPGQSLQPGKAAAVLYLPQNPARNSLYPHP